MQWTPNNGGYEGIGIWKGRHSAVNTPIPQFLPFILILFPQCSQAQRYQKNIISLYLIHACFSVFLNLKLLLLYCFSHFFYFSYILFILLNRLYLFNY